MTAFEQRHPEWFHETAEDRYRRYRHFPELATSLRKAGAITNVPNASNGKPSSRTGGRTKRNTSKTPPKTAGAATATTRNCGTSLGLRKMYCRSSIEDAVAMDAVRESIVSHRRLRRQSNEFPHESTPSAQSSNEVGRLDTPTKGKFDSGKSSKSSDRNNANHLENARKKLALLNLVIDSSLPVVLTGFKGMVLTKWELQEHLWSCLNIKLLEEELDAVHRFLFPKE